MKKIFLLCCLFASVALKAQVREIPTLKSKNIKENASKVAVNEFQFVKDKGLTLTQSDIETYDDRGRLIGIERTVHTTGLKYIYAYSLSKRGLLQQEKITNAANNQTVRTTDYDYKKGVLVSTTQVQGTVTTVKEYTHNKSRHLTGIKVLENGSLKGEEFNVVDEEGRPTNVSQKLATDEAARTISTFSYAKEGDLEIKTEIRKVNGEEYEIISRKDLSTNRSLRETTKNLSNLKSGFNNFLYRDDAKGSWTKAEVIDNQFGRSRLVLRKISYVDGTTTGRTEITSEDARARYFRQYDTFQVLYNGSIIQTSTAENLPLSTDRLVYIAGKSATVLLKGYDENTYQNEWHEAEIVSHTENDVFWTSNSSGNGIYVYLNGKIVSTSSYNRPLSSYVVGGSVVAHVSKGMKKSFVARGFYDEERKGEFYKAELSDDHNYWGKSSDTTYVLVGYGKSITLKYQAEDEEGNNLVRTNYGDYWYVLPHFRKNFAEGEVGDVFPAIYLKKPLEEISEKKLFNADFSTFTYDNLKNNQYRLRSADGLQVTNLTIPSVRTQDGELMSYFPLTKQYLRMDDYYELSDDQDFLDQQVSVLMEANENAFYVYNEGASIAFYTSGAKVSRKAFGAHKLDKDGEKYGAVLFDSLTKVSYGMQYDLSQPDGMGPMMRLPVNMAQAYLLKLDNGSWVVFEKGVKVNRYDYVGVDEGVAHYFFKDAVSGKVKGYRFKGYTDAASGEFIPGYFLKGKEATDAALRLNVDPLRPVGKSAEGGGN